MYRLVLITFLTFISTHSFASDAFLFQKIQYQRKVIIEFNSNIEKEVKLTRPDVYSYEDVIKNMINLHAANGDICYYSAWTSSELNGKCQNPSKYKNFSKFIKDSTSTKESYSDCKESATSSSFRCSPELFGSNTCVSYLNTDLTDACNRESQDKIPEILEEIKNNPQHFSAKVKEILNYCKNKTSSASCETFKKRIKDIDEKIEEKESIMTEDSKDNSKALSILNACKSDYDKSNDEWWDFTSTNKDILSPLMNSVISCNPSNLEIMPMDYSKIEQTFSDINNHYNFEREKELLENANLASFKMSIEALVATQIQNDGEVNPIELKNIIKKYPLFDRNKKYLKILDDTISMAKSKEELLKKKLYKDESTVISDFNKFVSDINKECSAIYTDYQNNDKMKKDLITNSSEENIYYDKKQSIISNKFKEFQAKNNYSNLFATDAMQSSVGHYNPNIAEDCAEDGVFPLNKVNANDIRKAKKQNFSNIQSGLNKINSSLNAISLNSKSGINEGLEDILTYRPYLLGDILKSNPNKDEQEYLATYLCKKTRDIYNSDEWFSVVDYTAAGATLVAATLVNVVPFAGQAASAALVSSVVIAGVKINDANSDLRNNNLNLSLNQESLTTAGEKDKAARTNRNFAVAEIALTSASLAARPGLNALKSLSKVKVADEATTTSLAITSKSTAVVTRPTSITTAPAQISAKSTSLVPRSSTAIEASKQTTQVAVKGTGLRVAGTSLDNVKRLKFIKDGVEFEQIGNRIFINGDEIIENSLKNGMPFARTKSGKIFINNNFTKSGSEVAIRANSSASDLVSLDNLRKPLAITDDRLLLQGPKTPLAITDERLLLEAPKTALAKTNTAVAPVKRLKFTKDGIEFEQIGNRIFIDGDEIIENSLKNGIPFARTKSGKIFIDNDFTKSGSRLSTKVNTSTKISTNVADDITLRSEKVINEAVDTAPRIVLKLNKSPGIENVLKGAVPVVSDIAGALNNEQVNIALSPILRNKPSSEPVINPKPTPKPNPGPVSVPEKPDDTNTEPTQPPVVKSASGITIKAKAKDTLYELLLEGIDKDKQTCRFINCSPERLKKIGKKDKDDNEITCEEEQYKDEKVEYPRDPDKDYRIYVQCKDKDPKESEWKHINGEDGKAISINIRKCDTQSCLLANMPSEKLPDFPMPRAPGPNMQAPTPIPLPDLPILIEF